VWQAVLALGLAVSVVVLACGTDGRGSLADRRGETTGGGESVAADTTTTTVFAPRRFTITASGDILLHSAIQANARGFAAASGSGEFDFTPMFAEIAPLVSAADLALCHLETPLSADNSVLADYPIFSAPREIADAVADAGYHGCSLASNHSLDQGFTGVVETLDVLDDAGLAGSGTARTPDERDNPPIHQVAVGEGNVAVGHLSYTYGLNGMPLPEEWMANPIDTGLILTDARRLRDRGAEFVVVSMHWGAEYQHEPTAEQLSLADEIMASPDVDVILGAHAHVVQPVDWVNDKPVIYGMGNSLSNQTDPPNRRDGVLVHLTVVEDAPGVFRVERVAYTPTWIEYPGSIIVPVTAESVPDSYQRTVQSLGLLGTFDGPAIYDPAELR
jgi:poly-gamma-glutamate synthesis protein (capsule biosynthesis protein)